MDEPSIAHGSCFRNRRNGAGTITRPDTHQIPGAILGIARLGHATAGVTLLGPLLILTGCGSTSETNVTGPSQPKCQVQAASEHVSFSPDGGTGTIRVDTTRECPWSRKSDLPRGSLGSPASGPGEGSVSFPVAS